MTPKATDAFETWMKLVFDEILEIKAGQDVMKSRLDRHSEIYENRLDKIDNKIDLMAAQQSADKVEMIKIISDNRVESVKGIEMTKGKVAALSGTVSMFFTLAIEAVKAALHK